MRNIKPPLEYKKEFLSDKLFWEFITENKDAYKLILSSFSLVSEESSKIIDDFIDKQLS